MAYEQGYLSKDLNEAKMLLLQCYLLNEQEITNKRQEQWDERLKFVICNINPEAINVLFPDKEQEVVDNDNDVIWSSDPKEFEEALKNIDDLESLYQDTMKKQYKNLDEWQ